MRRFAPIAVEFDVVLRVTAHTLYLHAVLHLWRNGNPERLIGPFGGCGRGPLGAVLIGDRVPKGRRNIIGFYTQLRLDYARIPHRMQIPLTGAGLFHTVAPPVVPKRHMQGLVYIPHPVPQKFQRLDFVRIGGRRIREDPQIACDGRYNAFIR